MAIIKRIEIDGRQVAFNASAAVPRIYRVRFGRDLFEDLSVLMDAIDQSSEDNSTLSVKALTTFEDIAYTMAKHADPTIPETPEEWLDGVNIFSIYGILPQIVEMWKLNSATTSESKKKAAAVIAP